MPQEKECECGWTMGSLDLLASVFLHILDLHDLRIYVSERMIYFCSKFTMRDNGTRVIKRI